MKKVFIFMTAAFLSGCTTWNNLTQDWSWNSLNPWAETDETQKVKETQEQLSVNKCLWQASLDKLAFMGINTENPQTGKIMTNWKSFPVAPNERFKFIVKIDKAQELRADALNVEVYKEVNGKNGWVRTVPSETVRNKIEQAIISKAKMLYINDYEEL